MSSAVLRRARPAARTAASLLPLLALALALLDGAALFAAGEALKTILSLR